MGQRAMRPTSLNHEQQGDDNLAQSVQHKASPPKPVEENTGPDQRDKVDESH
jgi:hypothetical protein